MARRKPRQCKDCLAQGVTTKRKAPHPGPRCASHHREFVRSSKERRHSTHIQTLYGLTQDEYWKIYEFQGGACAICQRAKGTTKRLSVDHDHETGAVRMLACTRCNRMLGHLRDDPEAFERAAECLRNPPADQALGSRRFVPLGGAPVKGSTSRRAGARRTTTGGGGRRRRNSSRSK